jgi:hypothetical protein
MMRAVKWMFLLVPLLFWLSIDHDMWGGGFLRAMNVDEDAELEVVVW